MELIPQDLFTDGKNAIRRFVQHGAYAENFGNQWHMFPKTQLDSHSGVDISASRLKRCLGEELWTNLEGKTVLEVGAGAGRFTEILLRRGAKVVSVDLSSAVEVNAANFKPNSQHAVIQADAMSLPFRPGSFDIVLCLGVIQHTPNPELTISKLSEQMAKGGWLVIDHYRFTLAAVSLRPFYRAVLKRLPASTALRVISKCASVFLPLHQRTKDLKPMSVLLNRVSPMITYYSAFPSLSDEAQREWALLDTFDALTDWYKHFRNKTQIRDSLESLGLIKIWIENGGNGVEARARKPLDGTEQE